MSDAPATEPEVTSATSGRQPAKKPIRMAASPVLWIILLFSSAGTIRWSRGWICIVFYVGMMAAIGLAVRRYNAALMEARSKWRHKDTKSYDKVFIRVLIPLSFLQPAVAGLDAGRFHWSSLPCCLRMVGAVRFERTTPCAQVGAWP